MDPMIAVLDVHLVGGESEILHIFLTIVGPLLISGAAVFAARTARDSAAERQERQLAHDTKRQEEALEHDRQMREKELGHDREIRRRERAQDTLDSALENLNAARAKTNALAARIEVVEKWRPKHEADIEKAANALQRTAAQQKLNNQRNKSQEIAKESFTARMALYGDWTRLILRFGRDHKIVKSFKATMESVNNLARCLNQGIERSLSKDEQARVEEFSTLAPQNFAKFTRTCREWDAAY